MIVPPFPASEADWERLCTYIVRSHLLAADMGYNDLSTRLAEMSVEADNKLISQRLIRGRFPATFFLQALYATGVTSLVLPNMPPDLYPTLPRSST